MRYMMIMRATTEAQETAKDVPFDEVLTAMGKYNESLIEAGVLLAGEGLAGPEDGFVVDFSSHPPAVTEGPYREAKDLFQRVLDPRSVLKGRSSAVGDPLPAGPGRHAGGSAGARGRRVPAGQRVCPEGNPVAS